MHRVRRGLNTDPLAEVVRVEGGRVVATLTRHLGSLDLAEDAFQEAALKALEHWGAHGLPANPGAWLTTTARNAALDRLRREQARGPKEEAAMASLDGAGGDHEGHGSMVRDDLLRLLFTCCHPALKPEARVALALRTLGGLTTTEIAAAFLVPEATMAQRITRAKKKIAAARIPYRVPPDHELPDRLAAVLAVVYVIFTEAHHSSTSSTPVRVDLGDEAVRLARLLVELMPDVPECAGLLALLLATHARRDARVDAVGNQVLLADQDRSRWDRDAIDEAAALVSSTLRRRDVGPYQVQAAIATLHSLARSAEETDWPQIVQLYGMLARLQPTAVVAVNRAVAVAQVDGPAVGLAALDRIDGVDDWHLYHAARAELLVRLDRIDEASAAFGVALGCDPPPADAAFLRGRVDAVHAGSARGHRPS